MLHLTPLTEHFNCQLYFHALAQTNSDCYDHVCEKKIWDYRNKRGPFHAYNNPYLHEDTRRELIEFLIKTIEQNKTSEKWGNEVLNSI